MTGSSIEVPVSLKSVCFLFLFWVNMSLRHVTYYIGVLVMAADKSLVLSAGELALVVKGLVCLRQSTVRSGKAALDERIGKIHRETVAAIDALFVKVQP